jgi:hypothetical protein
MPAPPSASESSARRPLTGKPTRYTFETRFRDARKSSRSGDPDFRDFPISGSERAKRGPDRQPGGAEGEDMKDNKFPMQMDILRNMRPD